RCHSSTPAVEDVGHVHVVGVDIGHVHPVDRCDPAPHYHNATGAKPRRHYYRGYPRSPPRAEAWDRRPPGPEPGPIGPRTPPGVEDAESKSPGHRRSIPD